jgi:hypothetical protein
MDILDNTAKSEITTFHYNKTILEENSTLEIGRDVMVFSADTLKIKPEGKIEDSE